MTPQIEEIEVCFHGGPIDGSTRSIPRFVTGELFVRAEKVPNLPTATAVETSIRDFPGSTRYVIDGMCSTCGRRRYNVRPR